MWQEFKKMAFLPFYLDSTAWWAMLSFRDEKGVGQGSDESKKLSHPAVIDLGGHI